MIKTKLFLSIASFALCVLALSGCSDQFMCNLNGTHCQPSATRVASAGGESGGSQQNCRPSGAEGDINHPNECCSGSVSGTVCE
jgi:hypothetical protein